MKAEFDCKKLKSGVQIKVKGELTIQSADGFRKILMENNSAKGSYILSLGEIEVIDVTAVQIILTLKQLLKANGRQLTLSLPVSGPVSELITKTGIKQVLQQ